MPPTIAVTTGDPRGIGPEVSLRAAASFLAEQPHATLLFIGADEAVPWDSLPREGSALFEPDRLDDFEAGAIAARSIERAARMALDGEVHAIVTAPIHKPSLRAAGWDVPGHTEMLRELSGSDRVGMLMAAEKTELDAPLRVLLATTHIRLAEVADALTVELLTEQSLLLHEALRTDWCIRHPRLALCALNPHASDGGLFGDEEERIFEPAIGCVRAGGGSIDGPIPADTVFQRTLSGEFDAVVAPYHDVGMAAFKTVAFGSGVNVTLGLPFVRTSPDHGTAFDIAGTGKADPASMLEAIRMAGRLARARFDTDSAHV